MDEVLYQIEGSAGLISASQAQKLLASGKYEASEPNATSNIVTLHIVNSDRDQLVGANKSGDGKGNGIADGFAGLIGPWVTKVGWAMVAGLLLFIIWKNKDSLRNVWSTIVGKFSATLGPLFEKLEFLSPTSSTILDSKALRWFDKSITVSYNDEELQHFIEQKRYIERVSGMEFGDFLKLKILLDAVDIDKAVKFARIANDGATLLSIPQRSSATSLVVR